MFSIVFFTIILLLIVYISNKDKPVIGKKLYIHSFLLWVFLMMFATSFKMLGWALIHFEEIPKYFYIEIGVIPDWLNITMWAIGLLFGIKAFILVYSLAKRSKKSREKLLKFLPIFYILTVYEVFKGGMSEALTSQRLILMILFSILIPAILYGSIYYFYRRKDVQNEIFIED